MDDGRINCATRSTCSAGRTRVLMNAAVSAAGHWMHSRIGSWENPFRHPPKWAESSAAWPLCCAGILNELTHLGHQEDTSEMMWIKLPPAATTKLLLCVIVRSNYRTSRLRWLLATDWNPVGGICIGRVFISTSPRGDTTPVWLSIVPRGEQWNIHWLLLNVIKRY